MNLIPPGAIDLILILLILPSLWRDQYESAVLMLCALRISMAIDGVNGDGIRSVLAHIYSRIRLDRSTGPAEDREAMRETEEEPDK
jgi:hypothetical protein